MKRDNNANTNPLKELLDEFEVGQYFEMLNEQGTDTLRRFSRLGKDVLAGFTKNKTQHLETFLQLKPRFSLSTLNSINEINILCLYA